MSHPKRYIAADPTSVAATLAATPKLSGVENDVSHPPTGISERMAYIFISLNICARPIEL
jgi:hypothetical protein